jgi:hypothetical protein
VIVALFGEWIRSRLFRPNLKLALVSTEGERSIAQFSVPIQDGMPNDEFQRVLRMRAGVPCRFFHVRVSNGRKWPQARDVRLYLTRLVEFDDKGTAERRWEGDLPLSAKNEDLFPPRKVVGPPIDFDVVSVDCEGFMHTHTAFTSFNLPQHARAPIYRHMRLVARCDELESEPIDIQVKWDGRWFDDWSMLKDHLIVRMLTEETPSP